MKYTTVTSLILAAVLILISGFSEADERYTVAAGDTLSNIGKRFGVSYRDIMVANNLRNTTIYGGQILVIPTSPNNSGSSASSHTYPKGGTNERYTAPPVPGYSDLTPYNPPLTNEPSVSSAPAYRAPVTRTTPFRGVRVPANASLQTYTVQIGDSVRSISKKFGVSFWDLRVANDIRFSRVLPGQVLKIPPKSNGFFGFFSL